MRAIVLAVLLTAVPILAGCVGVPDERPTSPDPSTPAAPREWPAIDTAPLRPGVQIVSPTGQCTSNFAFTSPDNQDVYFGLAAHCVEGMNLGDPVKIGGDLATGTLTYSSWMTMADVDEKDAATLEYNDFSLIRVDDAFVDLVHPAMRHFGGPIDLADSSIVKQTDKVVTYGNSGLRGGIDQASWHEGIVLERPDPWTTTVYTATPGIPGDSGSGAMTADGRALGIVVTLTVLPTAGSNGVTSLDLALAYAREHAGLNVQLATHELLDPGVIPR